MRRYRRENTGKGSWVVGEASHSHISSAVQNVQKEVGAIKDGSDSAGRGRVFVEAEVLNLCRLTHLSSAHNKTVGATHAGQREEEDIRGSYGDKRKEERVLQLTLLCSAFNEEEGTRDDGVEGVHEA